MAATSTQMPCVQHTPHLITVRRLSGLVADNPEDIGHGGYSGLKCSKARLSRVITRPTSGDSISMEHESESDSTTNDTARLRFRTSAGGDLTGAVVEVEFTFYHAGSGGISA